MVVAREGGDELVRGARLVEEQGPTGVFSVLGGRAGALDAVEIDADLVPLRHARRAAEVDLHIGRAARLDGGRRALIDLHAEVHLGVTRLDDLAGVGVLGGLLEDRGQVFGDVGGVGVLPIGDGRVHHHRLVVHLRLGGRGGDRGRLLHH
ncbi:MAG: hypothetical protein ACK559_36280, partial [bacterium]